MKSAAWQLEKKDGPSGAKARTLAAICGTAEAVPFRSQQDRRLRMAFLSVIAVFLAGCQQATSINTQVQEAIGEHLADRPGIDATRMMVEVETVVVDGDQAEAEVIFRSRDTPDSRMNYHYELSRADGKWKVESGRPSAAQSPHPQSGSGEEGSGTLPEGHPPVGGGTGE